MALRDGLLLYQELALASAMVEMDSLVVVMVLRNNHRLPWLYGYELRQCKCLLGRYELMHVFNHVADRLAAFAHDIQTYTNFDWLDQMPRSAIQAFRQDAFGFYSYRK